MSTGDGYGHSWGRKRRVLRITLGPASGTGGIGLSILTEVVACRLKTPKGLRHQRTLAGCLCEKSKSLIILACCDCSKLLWYLYIPRRHKTNKKVKWQYALEKRIKQLKKDLDTPVMATRRCRPRLRRPSLRHFQERYMTLSDPN